MNKTNTQRAARWKAAAKRERQARYAAIDQEIEYRMRVLRLKGWLSEFKDNDVAKATIHKMKELGLWLT